MAGAVRYEAPSPRQVRGLRLALLQEFQDRLRGGVGLRESGDRGLYEHLRFG